MWVASQSVQDHYIQLLQSAITNESLFKTFKSQRRFLNAVGTSNLMHSIEALGAVMIDSFIIPNMDKFKLNDTLGTPLLIGNTSISQDTTRFIETISYLNSIFDMKKINSITEVGSNYAGLCYMASVAWPNIKYNCVDLPEVQEFSKFYLSKLGVENVTFNEPVESTDLFISEYCISELSIDVIQIYWDVIISKANNIFMRTNFNSSSDEKWFLEKLRTRFNVFVTPERPIRSSPNKILVGKMK